MASTRCIRCSIVDDRLNKNVPEVNTFDAAMNELTETLNSLFHLYGIKPDNILHDEGQGSLWTRSMNGPGSMRVYRATLPKDAAFREEMLKAVLTYLTQARRVLALARWEVQIGEFALGWDSKRGAFQA